MKFKMKNHQQKFKQKKYRFLKYLPLKNIKYHKKLKYHLELIGILLLLMAEFLCKF
jgi:hypothetical protein